MTADPAPAEESGSGTEGGTADRWDRSDVVTILGRVTAALDGGATRPQQEEMVRAVDEAFRGQGHLAVQGPTGVGKTLAYLVPAVAAAGRGHRTLVVTSSRALQDQLARVDLPAVQAALPELPFSWAVLKGRSNYVCAAAVQEVQVDLARHRGDGPERHHQDALELDVDGPPRDAGAGSADAVLDLDDVGVVEAAEELLAWAAVSPTGDVAELEQTPPPALWSAVSVGPGECVGAANCHAAEGCASEAARDAAEQADIVVVNAHLYGAHVAAGGSLLPDHDQLVIDEAHAFEDALVGSLGIEMTEGRLSNLARVHRRCVAGDELVERSLRSAGQRLESALAARAEGAGPTRLVDGPDGPAAVAVALAVSGADRALNSLRRAARAAGSTAARHRVDRAVRTAEGVLADAQALATELGPGSVCWVEPMRSGRHALRLTRIDVADTLRSAAWERGSDPLTVVACSATLDRRAPARLGLDARYLAVESPFDFSSSAMLHVPRTARPNDPRWPGQVAEVVTRVVDRLDGRTLALFTSRRMLDATVAAVRDRLPGHRILAQGDAPNRALQEDFLRDEHASLFATASFWTGISSPGTTCSAVVIDKLPFPVPTDPIVQARGEVVGADRAFSEVSVPAAALQLAQGVGRLIRTVDDRGLVVVCDPRLAEAGYRSELLDLLPPMRRERNPGAVDRFIDSLGLPRRGDGTEPGTARSRPDPCGATGAGS